MTQRVPTNDPLAEMAAGAIAALRTAFSESWTGPNPRLGQFASDFAEVNRLAEPVRSVHGRLLGLFAAGVIACWSSAEDTLAAMEADLRRRPYAIWSPMALVRSLQEAVIFIRYLVDPALSLEQRLARIANVWLEDQTNTVNAAPDVRSAGAVNPRAEAISDRDDAVNELRSGGFDVQTGKKNPRVPVSVKLGSTKIDPIGYSTWKEALGLLPPDFPEAWRFASGAAHARPWYLTNNAVGEGLYGPWSAWADATAAAVSCAAFALDKGAETVGSYFGVGLSATRAQMAEIHKGFLTTAAVAGVGRTA